jgi:spore germination cell wall hydrolase CwlJ-like protein
MRLFPERLIGIATIWAEARSEPRSGQVAVGEVILERTKSGYSSHGTVESTVLWPKQFSCWNESTPWREKILGLDLEDPTVAEALLAWDIAEANIATGETLTKGAQLYHTIARPATAKAWPPGWATKPGVKEVVRIGGHVFYRDEGR